MNDPDESGVWTRFQYRIYRPSSEARSEFARKIAEVFREDPAVPAVSFTLVVCPKDGK